MRLSYRVYQKRELAFISFLDFPVPKEYDYLTAAVTKVFTELIASGYFIIFYTPCGFPVFDTICEKYNAQQFVSYFLL